MTAPAPPPHLTLLVGGQKSGKSRTAARLAVASGRAVVVVTPAEITDDEFAARVARHRADRPRDWTTVESFEVAVALGGAPPEAAVIVDALDTWLLAAMTRHGIALDEALDPARLARAQDDLADEVTAIVEAATRRSGPTVLVAGQPGLGLIGASPFTRRYVDLHGLMCTRIGVDADRVALVVAGRTLETQPWTT